MPLSCGSLRLGGREGVLAWGEGGSILAWRRGVLAWGRGVPAWEKGGGSGLGGGVFWLGGREGVLALGGGGRFLVFAHLRIASINFILACRLHVLAGVFPGGVDSKDNRLVMLWEETYIKNMKYAAQRLQEVI